MKFSKGILLFFILNLLIFSAFMAVSSRINTNNISTESIVISSENGVLNHIQISSTGVKEIWKTQYLFDNYDLNKIVDLDNDGQYEIISVVTNRVIQRIDFYTGEVIWEYLLVSNLSNQPKIIFGDITGDGIKEIILKRNAPRNNNLDYGFYILDANGNELKIIQTSYGIQIGPDNIELVDFNKDGVMELILSYGASLWDTLNRSGFYSLQYWKWQNNDLINIWNATGSDIGGNTELAIYHDGSDSIIITSGWYNNEIRAFNTDGELLWGRKSMPALSDDKITQMSSTSLKILIKNNKPILYGFTNNYWFNSTMNWLEIDITTGELIDTIDFVNTAQLIPVIMNEFLLIREYKQFNKSGELFASNIFNLYDLETKQLIGEYKNNGDSWYLAKPREDVLLDLGLEYPLLLALDENNKLWLSALQGKNIPMNSFAKILSVSHISHTSLKGTVLLNYINYPLITGIVLLIFNLSIYFGTRLLENHRIKLFHKKFGDNWKLPAYKRIKIIFDRWKNQSLAEMEPSKHLISAPVNTEEFFTEEKFVAIKPVKDSPQFENFIYSWLKKYGKETKKIKAGDIAILIEFLDCYPSIENITDIKNKFPDTANSTFYRRVEFLLKIGLLSEFNPKENYDMRSKKLEISMDGIEFLKSMFSSMAFYFM